MLSTWPVLSKEHTKLYHTYKTLPYRPLWLLQAVQPMTDTAVYWIVSMAHSCKSMPWLVPTQSFRHTVWHIITR